MTTPNALSADQITEIVTAALPDAQIEMEDLTGTSDHWSMRVVSSAFEGHNRVKRHRMIYAALKEPLKGPIHALALTTLTPEEAAKAP